MEMSLAHGHSQAQVAADKAESLSDGWIMQAVEGLRAYAEKTPGLFTIEYARSHLPPVPEGADSRAWGAVTRIAMRYGYIEQTAYFAPASSSNGSPKRLYRRPSWLDTFATTSDSAKAG